MSKLKSTAVTHHDYYSKFHFSSIAMNRERPRRPTNAQLRGRRSVAGIRSERVISDDRRTYTLRRLLLPEPGHLFDSPEVMEAITENSRFANVSRHIGVSLLDSKRVERVNKETGGGLQTWNALQSVACSLPEDLRCSVDTVKTMGAQGSQPGNRYVGYCLDSQGQELVQKDQKAIMRQLGITCAISSIAHISVLNTPNQNIAEELAAQLEAVSSLPAPVFLGRAEIFTTQLRP